MSIPAKVLIVEDERDLREILAYNLSRAGFAVVDSGNGTESILIAGREHPDVVLLDLKIPGLDGYSVCRSLRATSPEPHIIVVSSCDDAEEVQRGFDSGAYEYVRKPFRLKDLIARTQTAVDAARRGELRGGKNRLEAFKP